MYIMLQSINITHPKKSDIIMISQTSPKKNNYVTEYDLKENVFDPFKSSPPNNFMRNLQRRMSDYSKNNDKRNIE